MQPRKKESKKWSKIPADFAEQIKSVFEENFKQQLIGKKMNIEGRIYPSEIVLRVGINYTGEIRFHNFEVSLDHSNEKQNAISQIHLAVDTLASLITDYFENNEEHELPFVWEEFPFNNQKVWVQFNSENSHLEAEANRLLGISEDETLLTDEENAEFANDVGSEIDEESHSNDEDPEEDIDMSQPQIFSSKTKKKKEEMH